MIRENLYKILGLSNFASPDEIKKAYRSLALTHHPDRGGDEERMKLINAAHEILSKRKGEYDAMLRQGGRRVIIVRTWHYSGAGATDTASSGAWGWTFNSGN